MSKIVSQGSKDNVSTLDASTIADTVKTQVAETVGYAQDGLDAAAAKSSEELSRLSKTSTRFVRDNPALAVAGAAGIGLLVGLLVRSRS